MVNMCFKMNHCKVPTKSVSLKLIVVTLTLEEWVNCSYFMTSYEYN